MLYCNLLSDSRFNLDEIDSLDDETIQNIRRQRTAVLNGYLLDKILELNSSIHFLRGLLEKLVQDELTGVEYYVHYLCWVDILLSAGPASVLQAWEERDYNSLNAGRHGSLGPNTVQGVDTKFIFPWIGHTLPQDEIDPWSFLRSDRGSYWLILDRVLTSHFNMDSMGPTVILTWACARCGGSWPALATDDMMRWHFDNASLWPVRTFGLADTTAAVDHMEPGPTCLNHSRDEPTGYHRSARPPLDFVMAIFGRISTLEASFC
ncbi:hypothetical protein B0H13DRAFT_2497473 [Mycena leptocephala]|nr:hypothetical protein B0H13DRAFT_2497473 [Mycena leptocephala]